MKTILIYAGAWFGLMILAIINGTLREKVYGPFMDDLTAHQLSTVFGIILFGIFIWFLSGRFRINSFAQAISIGLIWLCTTVLFEFIFGHYVMGHSWGLLFYDYNLLKGRIWLLMLIWTASAPCIFYQIRQNIYN